MNETKHQKKNSQEAQSLVKDLKQKEEIDQKVNHYKSILKTYEDLSNSIDKKLSSYEGKENELTAQEEYEKCKLEIEKIEIQNNIYTKKQFFEMWLDRSKKWSEKFAELTKECQDNFDKTLEKAREISVNNNKLKQVIEGYDSVPDIVEKDKVELYLLLKFEISKTSKKYSFTS